MAEASKFAGALAKLKKPTEGVGTPSIEQSVDAVAVPASSQVSRLPVAADRGRGRPPGKRSNPDYEPTTVLLRKGTKRAASRKLEDTGQKADLSALIELLLEEWITKA